MRTHLIYIFFVLAGMASGAAKETGIPFITNFSPRDYSASNQNWSITQHPNGFVYIANGKGVLEYDGSQWRLIPLTNKAAALAVTTTPDGVIFVGGKNDFGYLAADSAGTLAYRSLVRHLSLLDRDFGDVWEVVNIKDYVYFRSSEQLFRLSLNDSTFQSPTIKSWKPKNSFHFCFIYDGALLIRDIDHGLYVLKDEQLQLLPNGEFFAREPVYGFIQMADSSFLAVSRTLGFFHYDGSRFTPLNTPAGEFTKQQRAIHIVPLANGGFAMATNVGVLFVDQNYNIVDQVNKKSGLRDNTVWYLYQDDQGGVWGALNNGIARIELPSPLTLFDDRTGLQGTVQGIIRHDRRLYIATSPSGVFYLKEGGAGQPFSHFAEVEGISQQSWQFARFKDNLLVAPTTGVYEINGTRAQQIVPERTDLDAACLFVPNDTSNRLFVGLFDGLAYLKWNGNRWLWEGRVEEINDEIRRIIQDAGGALWLGTRSNGLYRIEYTDSLSLSVTDLEHFSENEGLPAGQTFPFWIDGRLIATTENQGLFRFDPESNRFSPARDFGEQFSNGRYDVEIVAQDTSASKLWFGSEEAGRIHQLDKMDGNYQIKVNSLQRLPESAIRAIYPENNNVLWISTNEGLYRYDARVDNDMNSDYQAHVRRVLLLPDSLVYDGSPLNPSAVPAFDHSHNSLRFEFSAVRFDSKDVIQFQTILHGFEKDWSTSSTTTFKDYTNLPHGYYTFKVRAFDIYGRMSQEDTYSFRILPPFYRTWYAYLFYVLLLAGLLFIIDRIQRRRLSKRAQERTRIALLEAENKRKSDELERARNLQVSMLPTELPKIDVIKIAVFMKTATEVGGDYYDFIHKDGEFTGAIGDATGHGLNAGMMVSIIKGFFVSEAANMGIIDFFHKCNLALKRMHLKNIYMGMTIFKIKNKMLSMSSAGMPPAFHYQAATERLEELALPGMPLGAVRHFDYQQKDITLASGDVLFFMSDGFPELFDQNQEMIGYDRIPDILKPLARKSPNDIIIDLVEYAKKWADGRANEDDMTFVVLKIK